MCQPRGGIFERLCRALADGSRDVRGASADFAALSSNSARVDFAYGLVDSFGLFPEVVGSSKARDVAVLLRQEGNQLFKVKKDELALAKYTQSVACAPAGGEDLALAYANRSAVLLEHKLYKECLEDIGRAFSNNYPQHLHEKLLQRRERAESFRAIQPQIHYHKEPPALTYGPSRGIQCSGDCVEVKFQKNLGRHVVASRDIAVGDVVALEEPFAKILLKEHYLTHCHECLRPCSNLFPCDDCSLALFCGEGCKSNSCHKYECPILATLLELNVNKLTLVALKICICAKDTKESVESPLYRSQNYQEIHNLIANTDARSSADLFERAVMAAVIFELVQKHTDFFLGAEKDAFKERLLLHMQTGPSNFHEISELVRTAEGFYEVEETGAGAYAFLSLLNHSCCPNVVRHCYGSTIVLRALRPIRMGEQLFDNYGYHHAVMTRDERRLHLKKQYYFDCNCEACTEEWPLYHDLPVKKFDVGIAEEQITDLRNGNAQVAETCLTNLQKVASALEESRPCRELADVQEILKQCYAIFSNKRPVF